MKRVLAIFLLCFVLVASSAYAGVEISAIGGGTTGLYDFDDPDWKSGLLGSSYFAYGGGNFKIVPAENCLREDIILRASKPVNAHAAATYESEPSNYMAALCYVGPDDFGEEPNVCDWYESNIDGSFPSILYLSDYSNAHVEYVGYGDEEEFKFYAPEIKELEPEDIIPGLYGVSKKVCFEPWEDEYDCKLIDSSESCGSSSGCILEMSGETNAHVAACGFGYDYKLCCSAQEWDYVKGEGDNGKGDILCGNGVLDSGEICEHSIKETEPCVNWGDYSSGTMICSADCSTWIPKTCVGGTEGGSCGDGVINQRPELYDFETCDGDAWGNAEGKTCATQGLVGGELVCGDNCRFDTSDCYGAEDPDEGECSTHSDCLQGEMCDENECTNAWTYCEPRSAQFDPTSTVFIGCIDYICTADDCGDAGDKCDENEDCEPGVPCLDHGGNSFCSECYGDVNCPGDDVCENGQCVSDEGPGNQLCSVLAKDAGDLPYAICGPGEVCAPTYVGSESTKGFNLGSSQYGCCYDSSVTSDTEGLCTRSYLNSEGEYCTVTRATCVDPDGDGIGTMEVKDSCAGPSTEVCNVLKGQQELPFYGVSAVILTLGILSGFYVFRNRKV
jgi:hypothetical protein